MFELEVDDGEESYVVNLTNKNCDCGRWNLIGIPCKHAMASIVNRKLIIHNMFMRLTMSGPMPRHMDLGFMACQVIKCGLLPH